MSDLLKQLSSIQIQAKAFQGSDNIINAVLHLLGEISNLEKTNSKVFSIEKAYIEGHIKPGDYKLNAHFDGELLGHHEHIDFEVDFSHLLDIPKKLVEEIAKKTLKNTLSKVLHFFHL